ncbi:hypothetical protein [Companilactobacillus zhongbaensis]|uniref:hypothetical protein n=1 Tax=Companilactobacillus zhongbaensis TaxID=2486009 RepID=UPI0013DDA5F8|nr:hypothetical protein [Companilactobacillus zhongbaensis]
MKEDKKRKIELPKKITVVDGQIFFDETDNILKTDTGISIKKENKAFNLNVMTKDS